MTDFLTLRLDGAMMAIGAESVSAKRRIKSLPSLSGLTGLIAAALGYGRHEFDKLQNLQDNLIYAARLDRQEGFLTDYQTAYLAKSDGVWTTYGHVEKRGGASLDNCHIMNKEYHISASVCVALRVYDGCAVTIKDIAKAIDSPVHPLFLGRKCCPPSDYINTGIFSANTFFDALNMRSKEYKAPTILPESEQEDGDILVNLDDMKVWKFGVHAGQRIGYLRNGLQILGDV